MLKHTTLLLILITTTHGFRFRRQGFIDLSNSCRNPKGEVGVCLPIRQCPPLVHLLVTQRQQAEVADFLRQSVCGYDGLDPKVCCPQTQDRAASTTGPPILQKESVTSTERATSNSPDIKQTRLGFDCGKVITQNTRVVGGTNASLGAWPWMAALGYQSSNGGTAPVFLCAGSLITNKHVLTAAHCLANKKKLLVARVGDLNLYSDADKASPVDARIARTIIHEAYDPKSFVNDIGIIELAAPVQFTDHIQPVCIPLSRELRQRNYANRRPFIAGWGSVSYYGPSSPTLLELQVPVVAEADCKQSFAAFKTVTIDKRVICAGFKTGGKDACRGDSGGPLMDNNPQDKLFYQIGVVSYGYKCAEPGYPGIYTRVTEFADWIVNKVENKE